MTLLQAVKQEFAAILSRSGRPSALSGATAKRTTPVERMLLVAAAAQLLAGPRKNPTPAQLATARREVDARLRGSTTSGSWSSGSFWKSAVSMAKQAGQAAVRAAPQAATWATRNPAVVLPLATGLVASPFLIKAIAAAARTKEAKSAAAASPPPPPPGDGEVVVKAPEGAETPPPPAGDADDGPEISGCGWDDIRGGLTEEEVALAESGGASERAAILRTRTASAVGGVVSHDGYRAMVMSQAQRLAGGDPGTKHVFLAERAVRGALRRDGVKIAIPGAMPSRRTS